jgi:hypothetical protein
MSQAPTDPVSVVRGVYDAFARGDIAGFFALLAPDIVWQEAAGHPYGGVYVGHEAITRNVLARIGADWDDFSAPAERFIAEGDTVVTLGSYRGTCKATGKALVSPFAIVWTVRGGKVRALHQHTDTELFHRAMR